MGVEIRWAEAENGAVLERKHREKSYEKIAVQLLVSLGDYSQYITTNWHYNAIMLSSQIVGKRGQMNGKENEMERNWEEESEGRLIEAMKW